MAALTLDTTDVTGSVDASANTGTLDVGASLTYSALVLSHGPAAYWRMNDTATPLADATGNGRTATVTGSPTYSQTGAIAGTADNAILWSGTKYAKVAYGAWMLSANYSIECWVKHTSATTTQELCSRNENAGATGPHFRLVLASGRPRLISYNTAGTQFNTSTAALTNNGAYHHIVGTVSGTSQTLYVDGISVATGTITGTPTDGSAQSDGMSMAIQLAQTATQLSGTLDEVAYYTTALTSTQVATHYAAGLAGFAGGENTGLKDTLQRDMARTFNDSLGPSDTFGVSFLKFLDGVGLVDSADTDVATKLITATDLISTPGISTITIAGGVPLETVTINLVGYGSNPLATDVLDEVGTLSRSVLIPAGYTGAQSLQFVLSASGTIVVPFDAGAAPTGPTTPGAPTPPTPVTTVRWVLEDPGPGGVTYTFPNNPATMSSQHPRRALTALHTTSPVGAGQALVWEGATRPYSWEFTGYCGTEAFYDALKLFVDIGRRFYLTDHRSQQWIVSFDFFDAQTRRDLGNFWAHDYTMRATIYGGPL